MHKLNIEIEKNYNTNMFDPDPEKRFEKHQTQLSVFMSRWLQRVLCATRSFIQVSLRRAAGAPQTRCAQTVRDAAPSLRLSDTKIRC